MSERTIVLMKSSIRDELAESGLIDLDDALASDQLHADVTRLCDLTVAINIESPWAACGKECRCPHCQRDRLAASILERIGGGNG